VNDLVVARRYRLGKRIGAGGMGRVWLAVDEVLRREVAIKEILLPDGLTEDDAAELRMRTLREARTAAALSHPNVIKIYDVIYAEQRPWIVMEYVESRSLAQVIKDDGPMSPEAAARIGLSVLAALVAAHEAGVLHRDVKPGNVLLGADDRVVLTDFGLATFDDVGSALTASGVVHGSPQFIAPERALDGTSTSAADMWSLGATLYAAVEGRAPYARASSYATLTALATAPPDPPRNAGPLKPLLGGLLRRNPANRMKPDEVRSWLQQVASATAPRSHVIPRQRRNAEPEAPSGGSTRAAAVPPTPSPSGSGPAANPSVHRERRNHRPFSDSAGMRRRAADPRAADPRVAGSYPVGNAPVTGRSPDLDMPIAGAPPPAVIPAPTRPVSSAQAAYAHPVEDERDTDHQMDLAWQLDAAAGLFGNGDAAARPRSAQRVERRRRARLRRIRWISAILGVAVVATISGYAVEHAGHKAPGGAIGPSTTSGSTMAALSLTWPCTQLPATALGRLPAVKPLRPSESPLHRNLTVPSGFRWYTFGFGDGLTGAAPIGWLVADGLTQTCFYDPDTTAVLGVEALPTGTTDAVGTLKEEQQIAQKSGLFPNYHLDHLTADPVTPGVADWEFTFDAPAAVGTGTTLRHGIVHLILRAGQAGHAICWIVPDTSWTTEFSFYNLFMPSYEIPAPAAS
jgi:eukaryotic-like serine/threonine-protein kinase